MAKSGRRTKIPKALDRRTFITATGGAMAAAALSGCGDTPFESVSTGTVKVEISGVDPAAVSAGTAVITASDGTEYSLAVPNTGTGEEVTGRRVEVGVYTVVYTAPEGHTLLGETNEFEVTIAENMTSTVSVTLQVLTVFGVLRISVAGLRSGAVSGGGCEITRTDVSGEPPVTVGVPGEAQGGTTDVSLTPGTYSVDFTPPAGHGLAPGETNPRTTSVTENQTAAVTFTVEAAQPAAGLVFASDWSTATGASVDAKGDGGKWATLPNGIIDRFDYIQVVSASALDFPAGMASCLRIELYDPNNSFGAIGYANSTLGQLTAGNTRYWRVYFRNGINADAGSDGRFHPMQMGDKGGNVAFWLRYSPNKGGSGEVKFEFHTRAGTHSWSLSGSGRPDLVRDNTYRLEWAITRLAAPNGYHGKLQIRIYDSRDVITGSTPDFGCMNHGGFNPPADHNLDETVEDVGGNGANLFWSEDEDWVRTGGMRLVAPGDSYGPGSYCYWGGYAVSDSDWCGRYVPGEGS